MTFIRSINNEKLRICFLFFNKNYEIITKIFYRVRQNYTVILQND